jgi:DNA-directed RNA polymerase alpha subunit
MVCEPVFEIQGRQKMASPSSTITNRSPAWTRKPAYENRPGKDRFFKNALEVESDVDDKPDETTEEKIEKGMEGFENVWAWAIHYAEEHLRKCPLYPHSCPMISPPIDKLILKKSVKELGLGRRALHAIRICRDVTWKEIESITVADLLRCTESELYSVKNCGEITLDEIKQKLEPYGLYLKKWPIDLE